ncbi:hypothetical protein NPIL_113661 [Nephila pilipes]|uniref:Uncharacterized protein n=1 Tax=Nephila pilipes TaxID=299642 RepID=A0A8X6PXF7_NEPPI|nr:hypothetical protein NPIL_113661 [Nephila pilipes]
MPCPVLGWVAKDYVLVVRKEINELYSFSSLTHRVEYARAKDLYEKENLTHLKRNRVPKIKARAFRLL